MTTRLHPLHTDLPRPERFTWPFAYEPHPLCLLATAAVKQELERIRPSEGKMFGVLVVELPAEAASLPGFSRLSGLSILSGETGSSEATIPTPPHLPPLAFLAAYSGLLEGRNDWDYFVPPVFDAQQPDGHFKQTEREISRINHEISRISQEISHTDGEICHIDEEISRRGDETLNALKARRRQLSEDLQQWLFSQYRLLNARGEERCLIDVWQDYHCSARIRKKYPLPPGGTGDCCAPKLLQYAYRHGLRPVCMAEFWWGEPPRSEVRHHGQFYPACRGKCKPVLTWMMQGLHVDPDPDEAGLPRLEPDVVYEDEAMAVLNKPSGLLSVPGRAEHHSVATIAQERWPGSMPVHRLDMGTSGLIVVAKYKEAYLALQEQFVRRTVKKRYIAVLEGNPAIPEGTPAVPETTPGNSPAGTQPRPRGRIELPMLSDPMNRPRQVVDHRRGKSAVTEYEVLARATGPGGQPLTLVALYPLTGRTHQLRVHCAHRDGLGCPILGDELYGHAPGFPSSQNFPGSPGNSGSPSFPASPAAPGRLCLHSDRLELLHPLTGRPMRFELAYPFGNLIAYNNK